MNEDETKVVQELFGTTASNLGNSAQHTAGNSGGVRAGSPSERQGVRCSTMENSSKSPDSQSPRPIRSGLAMRFLLLYLTGYWETGRSPTSQNSRIR